jgi:hypothetical protein
VIRLKGLSKMVHLDHIGVQRAKIVPCQQAPYPFMPFFAVWGALLPSSTQRAYAAERIATAICRSLSAIGFFIDASLESPSRAHNAHRLLIAILGRKKVSVRKFAFWVDTSP